MHLIPVEAHLALNHVPLIGLVFGLVFFMAGVWRSSEQAMRAGLIIFLAMGIAGWAVVGSGMLSADILADAAWLDAPALNSHRLAGILTFVVLVTLATLSGVTLFMARRNGRAVSARARNAVLLLAVAGIAANLWTAYLGGALRHTELASGLSERAHGVSSRSIETQNNVRTRAAFATLTRALSQAFSGLIADG